MTERVTIIPYFLHDCDVCIFVMQGRSSKRRGIFPSGSYDVYVCPGEPCVVVRTGDDGWEYSSHSGHGKDSWFAALWQSIREDFGQDEMALYKAILRHAVKQRRKTDRAVMRSIRRQQRREAKQAVTKLFRELYPLDDSAEQIF